MLQNDGKKEQKMYQVKMLQRDKMPLRDKMSQFMRKIWPENTSGQIVMHE
jgi:hypothetical protein